MEEYHKIKTVWLRAPETNFKTLLENEWATPEFKYLQNNQWTFTEKVDGTNIRVQWEGQGVSRFGGRTDRAQIPAHLVASLQDLFPEGKLSDVFGDTPYTLYGEGYGAKIQKGGGDYIQDGCSFILFDVRCGGHWLQREDVEDIASRLGIEVVPIIGMGTLHDAIDLVRGGFSSKLKSSTPEGIVMRPSTELTCRGGKRIISKLKCKDFQVVHENKISNNQDKGEGEE